MAPWVPRAEESKAAAGEPALILPGEVGEGLVGVGHAVDVLAAGDGGRLRGCRRRPARRRASMAIGRPFFSRAAIRSQRMARVCWRFLLTCIGTW